MKLTFSRSVLLAAALLLAGAAAQAAQLKSLQSLVGGNDQEFLPPDVAFVPGVVSAAPSAVHLHWDIHDGYYLYRDRFKFSLVDAGAARLGDPQFPPGQTKVDDYFGKMVVYHKQVDVTLPLSGARAGQQIQVKAVYQGCADKGLCYPPITRILPLTLAAADSGTAEPAAGATATETAPRGASGDSSEQDRLAGLIREGNLAWVMLSFAGFGLLLAFTPCVLPMVPILSGIIVGQKNIGGMRAFSLSLVYVLAMAATYALVGAVIGFTGANLQIIFQNPWVIGAFAALFVALALSMFGLYEIQMPAALQNRVSHASNRQRGGTLLGVATMGFLSTLIVGPCTAAPLAGAFLFIGQSGDALRGGLSLFALGLGMGVPLLAVGTSAGKLVPRAGAWMNAVKAAFGVLMLAVAVWFLDRIVPGVVSMLLWGALLIGSAVYLGAVDHLAPEASGWRRLWKACGLILLAWGVAVVLGAAAGGSNPLAPLETLTASQPTSAARGAPAFRPIKTTTDLDRALAAAGASGRPVMLDFYADWCISCKEMEHTTFRDPGVQRLMNQAVLLRADVTANDAADQALMQ
ncbi:MAG: protein-disulfide reductase DsbD, partial [Gammaproteobacteria bacterium]